MKIKISKKSDKGKGKVFYGQEPPSGESTTTESGVNYQLLAVITEVAQWELLVAVDHNQLRTMASETVDPINWSHPSPSWAVPPERHLALRYKITLQHSACVVTTLPMRSLRV